MVLSLLLRDESMDKMEVSEVSDKHSVGVQGKYRQAVSVKAGRCPSKSFSSSGGENKNIGIPAHNCRNCVRKSRGTRVQRRNWVRKEGRLEEAEQMEVDEEVDSKKNWIKGRKICKNSCEISRSSRICRRTFRAGSKKSGSMIYKKI